MNTSERNKTLAIGILLTAIGFMGGFLTGGHRQSGPHPMKANKEWRQQSRSESVAEIRYRCDHTGPTVFIIQDGHIASASNQAVSALPANERVPNKVWLFLLLASAAAPITWVALLWNRRRQDNPCRQFVPRRDD